jgi:hypothetical protein
VKSFGADRKGGQVMLGDIVDKLELLAVPVGIGLAVVAVLVIPKFRRGLKESDEAGRQAGDRFAKQCFKKK